MRVKTGFTRRRRHHKLIKKAKGMRMTKGRLYKVSHEAILHAGQYAYIGRKKRKRDMRKLWIQRINAQLKKYDLKYSKFIALLKKEKILLDRKILAHFAAKDNEVFTAIVNALVNNKQK